MLLALQCLCALALDRRFGEPPTDWHPLILFGRWILRVEGQWYGPDALPAGARRVLGVMAVMIVVLPMTTLTWLLCQLPYVSIVIEVGLLYIALGARSLHDHAQAVVNALQSKDLDLARRQVARIVSRDTHQMTEQDISLATVESVLENGCDAIFGALFWFCIAGGAGVVAYRLINTLDAMWGYRTPRYEQFGWAAARLDDLMNWLPARLTALSYTLVGDKRTAWRCWHTQGSFWKSPNAGPVMAAGAGALRLQLGGTACYHGQWVVRPALGEGILPRTEDILRALQLVNRAIILWLLVSFTAGWLGWTR